MYFEKIKRMDRNGWLKRELTAMEITNTKGKAIDGLKKLRALFNLENLGANRNSSGTIMWNTHSKRDGRLIWAPCRNVTWKPNPH